ncbi:hypothetical protein CO676_15415 [Sinorhizobium sp. BJ1]|nr:hypothetical protein CO676_15415 [Sinorhizobium sp. BJ1]
MVAEVRSGLYHRLDVPELIDLGTWQIALKSAIHRYLMKRHEISAANTIQSGNSAATCKP